MGNCGENFDVVHIFLIEKPFLLLWVSFFVVIVRFGKYYSCWNIFQILFWVVSVAVQVVSKQRTQQSVMRQNTVNANYTIFDALLETMKKKEQQKAERQRLLKPLCQPLNMVASLSVAVGSVAAVWVANLVWLDMRFWGKDLALILFGSRVGEAISLGIGLQVFHYVVLAATFLLFGLFILFRSRLTSAKE